MSKSHTLYVRCDDEQLEHVEADAAKLREQVKAWFAVILDELRNARPELPDSLTDRQQDGAEPLLAIADVPRGIGLKQPGRAFAELCAEAQASDQSIGIRLLIDIRQIFGLRDIQRISSSDLAAALAEIETSPWGEWGKQAKPISAAKLARLLKPDGITPHGIRIDEKTPKGYELEDFSDSFERHLPALPPLSPHKSATVQQNATTPTECSSYRQSSKCSMEGDVALQKREIADKNGPCGVVALLDPPTGAGEPKLWSGPAPTPVPCVHCDETQASALALSKHL